MVTVVFVTVYAIDGLGGQGSFALDFNISVLRYNDQDMGWQRGRWGSGQWLVQIKQQMSEGWGQGNGGFSRLQVWLNLVNICHWQFIYIHILFSQHTINTSCSVPSRPGRAITTLSNLGILNCQLRTSQQVALHQQMKHDLSLLDASIGSTRIATHLGVAMQIRTQSSSVLTIRVA